MIRRVLHKDVAIGWKWRPTHEVAWYASTQQGNSAAYYAAATRGHRGVENRVHYMHDVFMHEDASRVRKSPTILSILRSFAVNILRLDKITDTADALWRNLKYLESNDPGARPGRSSSSATQQQETDLLSISCDCFD